MQHYKSIATFLAALVAFGLFTPHARAQSPASESATPLLGCWQHADTPTNFLRFEPSTCGVLKKDHVAFYRARYEPGRIVLNDSGRSVEWTVKVADAELSVTSAGGTNRYRRVTTVPPEFDPKPMLLPKAKDLTPNRVKSIQSELLERERKDQAVRNDSSRENEQDAVDFENTEFLTKWVKEVGWIDAKRFGQPAANAAWLLTVHSDRLPLMLAALPEIEKDVKAKRLPNGENFANLYDRTQLRLGRKQRFGTQIGQNDRGEFILLALENRAKVDALRKEIGLPLLAQELEKHKRWTGSKEIRIEEDEPSRH